MIICSIAHSNIDWLCLKTQKVRALASSDQNKKCSAVSVQSYHHKESGIQHKHMFVDNHSSFCKSSGLHHLILLYIPCCV